MKIYNNIQKRLVFVSVFFVLFLPITFVFAHETGIPHEESLVAAVVKPPVVNPPTQTPLDPALVQQIKQVESYNSLLKKFGKDTIANKNTETQFVEIAKKRKAIMKILARKAPIHFIILSLSSTDRASLSPQVQSYIEKRENLNGELQTLHIDDFQNPKNSVFKYTLKANGNKYEVLSYGKIAEMKSGNVRTSGITLDNIIMLDKGGDSIIPLAGQGNDALGEQRVLAVIVNMTGNKSTVSIDEAKEVLFNKSNPFQKYYIEQSYGKMSFVGDVYEITLNRSSDNNNCGSGVNIQDDDVNVALTAQNVDLSKYDRVLFLPPIGYCSLVGRIKINVNGKDFKLSQSWVGFSFVKTSFDSKILDRVLAHEIGHALGLWHANFLSCRSTNECSHEEYGNPYDVMGTGIGHFNALYKEQLGWITDKDIVNIASDGKYSIGYIDEAASKIKAAKIVNPAIGPNSVSYLEKREERKTLMLNVPHHPSKVSNSDSWLISLNPNGITDMVEGGTYTLPSRGVKISSISKEDVKTRQTNFDIRLSAPTCGSISPVIINSFPYYPWNYFISGGDINVSLGFTNPDFVCRDSSKFILEFPDLPAGWMILDKESNLTDEVSDDSIGFLYARIKIPDNAPENLYQLNVNLKNISSGSVGRSKIDLIVMKKPKILSVIPDRNSKPDDKKDQFEKGDKIIVNTDRIDFDNTNVYLSFINPDINFVYNSELTSTGGGPFKLISFRTTIPEQMPAGKYNLALVSYGGNSELYPVTIGTIATPIEINATSSKLAIIGSSNNPDLEATFDLVIKGDSRLDILIDPDNQSCEYYPAIDRNKSFNAQLKLIENPDIQKIQLNGTNYMNIKAGVNYKIVGKCRLRSQILKPDSYYAKVDHILYRTPSIVDQNSWANVRGSNKTNTVDVVAPRPIINPTVTLKSSNLEVVYGKDRLDALLRATFNVEIVSGSEDVYFYEFYPAATYILNKSNNQSSGIDEAGIINSSNLHTVTNKYGNKFYAIPKNSKVNLTFVQSASTKKLFAGSYVAVLQGFYFMEDGFSRFNMISVDRNESNSKTIIGEVSPYISRIVGTSRLGEKDTLNIEGQRLHNSFVVIDGIEYPQPQIRMNISQEYDQATVGPMPSTLSQGIHYLSIKNPANGESNQVSFEYQNNSRTTDPNFSITSSNAKFNSGDTVQFNFNFPAKTIKASLVIACPKGISTEPINVCNKAVDVTSKEWYKVSFKNSTNEYKQFAVNYYVYLSDKPTYANGISIPIFVYGSIPSGIKEGIEYKLKSLQSKQVTNNSSAAIESLGDYLLNFFSQIFQ